MFRAATKKDDRRTKPRNKVLMRAAVSWGPDGKTMECCVRDATMGGCRLVVRDIHAIPDKLWIRLPNLDAPVTGYVVWRNGREAGVAFDWGSERKATS